MKTIIFIVVLSFTSFLSYSQIKYSNCSETQSNPIVDLDSGVSGMTDVKYSEIYEGQYKYYVIKNRCEPNKGLYIISNKKLSIISKEQKSD